MADQPLDHSHHDTHRHDHAAQGDQEILLLPLAAAPPPLAVHRPTPLAETVITEPGSGDVVCSGRMGHCPFDGGRGTVLVTAGNGTSLLPVLLTGNATPAGTANFHGTVLPPSS
jgi:hypothetical protein